VKSFQKKYSWENLFYLLSAYVMTRLFASLYEQQNLLVNADWLFPLNFLPIRDTQIFIWTAKAIIVAQVILALIPIKGSAFFSLLSWCLWISMANSFGVVHNSEHGFFLVALGIAISYLFKDSSKSLFYAMVANSTMYISSGMWKARFLLHAKDIYTQASLNLPGHIAFGMAENFQPERLKYLNYFNNHFHVSSWSWIGIILLEVLVPITVVFIDLSLLLYPVIFIAFHFAAKEIIGPGFQMQRELLLLFFIIVLFEKINAKGLNRVLRSK
jgi:hypothetical protein